MALLRNAVEQRSRRGSPPPEGRRVTSPGR